MSVIEITGDVLDEYKLIASNVAKQVIDLMGQPNNLEVAIEFVSDDEIQRLNREIRGIDKVTDVLYFPSMLMNPGDVVDLSDFEVQYLSVDGYVHFGDMAICFNQTKRQADEFGVSVESEIKKLVIHSMLHLMGYDHIDDDDYEIMNAKELELDKKICL